MPECHTLLKVRRQLLLQLFLARVSCFTSAQTELKLKLTGILRSSSSFMGLTKLALTRTL